MKRATIYTFTIVLSTLNILSQDLTGSWQGLEFNPGAPFSESWPSVLTINQSAKSITGTLMQVAAVQPSVFVHYSMKGTVFTLHNISLSHQTVIDDRKSSQFSNWCFGNFTLTYDESQEKISGTVVYTTPRCVPGTIELYRIKLKSSDVFCFNEPIELHVTGNHVRWYLDEATTEFIGSGNTFKPAIQESTTFYVTQTYYGIESPAVPISIQVNQPTISSITTTKSTSSIDNGQVAAIGDGTAPLRYKLNGGQFQSSPVFKDLAAGLYSLIISDAHGCTASEIFEIQLDQVNKVNTGRITQLHGQVFNKHDLESKVRAVLTFVSEHDSLLMCETDANGIYSIKLKENVNYHVSVNSSGFVKLQSLVLPQDGSSIRNFFLEKIPIPKINERIPLNNVLFEWKTSKLLSKSSADLDALAEILILNPSIEIKLEGHTDKGDDDNADMKLSIERVDVIKQYLVNKGIRATRISVESFGNTRLLFPPPNEKNRRVEFVVVKQ